MSLDKEKIKHVAKLARISVDEAKVDSLTKDLNSIFKFIEQLNELKIEVGRFKGGLIELKNWLINQRCLVAPDSMAGQLAAYVQIPVISVFGSQDPKLTRPVIKMGAIVKPDKPCNHSSNHWRFCRKCMESIQPLKVFEAVCKEIN